MNFDELPKINMTKILSSKKVSLENIYEETVKMASFLKKFKKNGRNVLDLFQKKEYCISTMPTPLSSEKMMRTPVGHFFYRGCNGFQ